MQLARLNLNTRRGLPALPVARRVAAVTAASALPVSFSQEPSLLPNLAAILRRDTVGNWLMPYMSAITPTYVEAVLRGGLAGNHTQMHQLFDLMWDTDPEIQACIGEYVDGVLSKKVLFEPWHEEDEEPSEDAVEKCKLVSYALRSMRPSMASDEHGLKGTIEHLLAARFHGQSVMEIDWYDTYGDGKMFQKPAPPSVGNGQGVITCPRSTYWVNPVCYGYDSTGRMNLLIPSQVVKSSSDTQNQKLARLKNLKQSQLTEASFYSTTTGLPSPVQFMEFPANKFLIGIGKGKTGSALAKSVLRPLAWWWVASNFCGDFLMKNAELFGVPFRSVTYSPSLSDPQKSEIKQMLQSMGSSGWALLPEGTALNFERATTQGGQSPQAFLYNLADTMKRKVILHQTMSGGLHDSMGKGGGQAFGAVESDTKDQCIQQGADFACDVINQQLIPYILNVNYGEGGDLEAPTMTLVNDEAGGLVDAQRDTALAQIMDVPDSYLRRKYKVPKATDADKIAGVDGGVMGAQAERADQQHQDQMDMQQSSNDAAMEQAKAQQAQAEQQAQAGGNSSDEDEQDLRDERQEDVEAREGRVRLSLEASNALKATTAPLLARLAAIGRVPDLAMRRALLRKFVADVPAVASAMRLDAGVAQALEAGASDSKFGCLMAMLPDSYVNTMQQLATRIIADDTLTGDEVETEPHVTVLYGFPLDFDTDDLKDFLESWGDVELTVGELERFECPDYDVLKFAVTSPDLKRLNAFITKKLLDGKTNTQYAYNPHLTLAYVAKGTNQNLDGTKQSVITGKTFTISQLLYSLPDQAGRTVIKLK